MLKRFAVYFEKYKKYLILGCLCVVFEAIAEQLVPLLMADIIDVGIQNGDRRLIITRGIQMVACALVSLVLGIVYARMIAKVGQGVGAEIRKAEYQKIQKFSFKNIDNFSTSSLVTRLTSDVNVMQTSITTGVRPIVRSPVMIITAITLSFTMNARLALVFVVAAPVLAISLMLIIKNIRPKYVKMQKAIDAINRVVQENLIAIRLVKSYVRGNYEKEKFEEVNQKLQRNTGNALRVAVLNLPLFQFVMYGTIVALLYFGGNFVFAGDLGVGQLTGFLSYILQILNGLMLLSNVFLLLTRCISSGERIVEVLDEELDIIQKEESNYTIRAGNISFQNVSFKYNENAKEYVLNDINLDIHAGETIGIIGGTGSAKTSLVQLIPRLYEISSGRLLIDNRDIGDYSLAHLRDAIGMVLQKNTLFSGTIKSNLLWGSQEATKEELEWACRIACADEFIDAMPEGINAFVEQGGVNLSGGQKQRLCIARAILKSPKVLIFDDSTSAVDTATDAKIRESLKEELVGTTQLIISQRVSSIVHADKIVILEDGKIIAIGDHDTLLKTSEIYAELCSSQQKGVEL